jgi:hypothetical protein
MRALWIYPTIVALTLFAAGCVTAETKARLDAQENSIATLAKDIITAEAAGSDVTEMKARLAQAQADLVVLKADATKERVGASAGIGASIAENVSPIAGLFLPIVGTILSGLGAGLRVLQTSMVGKK